MNRLELVPLPGEDSRSPLTERLLTIGVGDIPHGCAVFLDVVKRGLLSSAHTTKLQEELWETAIGKPRLTRDNPFLNEAVRRHLDDHGLVREGTRVAFGDVLVSILDVDLRTEISGRSPPEAGMQWATDQSWQMLADWEDVVVATVRRQRRGDLGSDVPNGLLERIEIVLRAERPLQIGDVLLVADHPVVVSSFTAEPPCDRLGDRADIVVSPDIAKDLGLSSDRFLKLAVAKREDRAALLIQSRNDGPYSLISQSPLRKPPYGGQLIAEAHVEWLRARGLYALVGEMVSLKCDDVLDRPSLRTLQDQPGGSVLNLPRPAAPQSLAEIAVLLAALGLYVNIEDCGHHVSLKIRPATAEQIVEQSAGQVTKAETIHFRSYEDIDDGLFAPNVFGPSNWMRRRRFGHIKLAVRIVPMLWRLGTPSLMSHVTGLDDDDIKRLLKHEAEVLWQGGRPRLVPRSHEPCDREGENLGAGASAIRGILARRPDGELPESVRDVRHSLVTDVVFVLPPDWRPLVLLDNGNFATSDLNDLYRRVINRNNRIKKLMELGAPAVIIDNECGKLQEAVDSLHANVFLPEGNTSPDDAGRRLVDVLLFLLGRIRQPGKYLDWSGEARFDQDAAVPPDQVLVPRTIFEKLRLSEQLPLLLACSGAEGRFIARLPRAHDELVLRVSPASYAHLAGKDRAASVAQVHRPVTEAGRDEALRLINEEPVPYIRIAHGSSRPWFESESAEELAESLVAAAVSGEAVPLSSSRGLMLGGTGSIQFADDHEVKRDPPRQIAIPDEE